MQFHDTFGKREAKTCAFLMARVGAIDLLERVENAHLMFGRDADAAVFNLNDNLIFFGVSDSRADANRAAIGREFNGVGKQVIHHLFDFARIARHRIERDDFG